ncbi:hypothetical protein D3C81_1955540 [compost metagenome]
MWNGTYAGAGLQGLGTAGAVVEDFCAVLVAEHHALVGIEADRNATALEGVEYVVAVMEHVQVRAADAAGERFHQYLALPRLGVGEFFHQKFVLAHDYCFHGVIFPGLS